MKLRSCFLILALALPMAAQQKLAFTKMQELIDKVKSHDFTEAQAVRIIKVDGVDFEGSDDNLNALRNLGASDVILDAIRSVAPAPVRPPKPPPPPTGTLSVRCDPAECDIKINGK